MGYFLDRAYDFFDRCISKCDLDETSDELFEQFLEEIKKETREEDDDGEIVLYLAERMIRSISNEDKSMLDNLLSIIRTVKGYSEEDAFLMHSDPDGFTFKGTLPSNVSIKIQGKED